jgi:outer membrane protein assembly factor BamD
MRLRLLPLLAAGLLAACHSAPPYQGMDAAALYALAQQKYEAKKYDEVERALTRLFAAFPSYPQTPVARLLLADSYFAHKQYITAEAEYRRFLDRYPGDSKAPVAALGVCTSAVAQSPAIQRDQSATEAAETTCRNVAADYPNAPQGQQAAKLADEMKLKLAQKLNAIGEYYLRHKFYESSVVYFEMVENQYADTSWAPTALANIVKAYQKIGYQDLVAETRKKILDAYPNSPEAQGLKGLASDSTATAAPARIGGNK